MLDMTGRTCVVTGANTGIGKVTARELARMGARVILACRSEERTGPVVEAIRSESGPEAADFVALDLGDLGSVRACAEGLLARDLPVHVLINNAGLAGQRGQTKDGFELAFGVNHLGHFLLTALLRERIEASAPARIVTVASQAHYRVKKIDWEALRRPTRSVTGIPEYGVSKLCNVLFSAELSRRIAVPDVSTYAVHPGVVASDVWRRVPWPFRSLMKMTMISNEEGAETSLHCATSPELAERTGLYWDECRPKEPSALAKDESLAAELWRRSEAWAGLA